MVADCLCILWMLFLQLSRVGCLLQLSYPQSMVCSRTKCGESLGLPCFVYRDKYLAMQFRRFLSNVFLRQGFCCFGNHFEFIRNGTRITKKFVLRWDVFSRGGFVTCGSCRTLSFSRKDIIGISWLPH